MEEERIPIRKNDLHPRRRLFAPPVFPMPEGVIGIGELREALVKCRDMDYCENCAEYRDDACRLAEDQLKFLDAAENLARALAEAYLERRLDEIRRLSFHQELDRMETETAVRSALGALGITRKK